MEHSEEYYKLKYFKYKAKYTKQKQAQQSGGASLISKKPNEIATNSTKGTELKAKLSECREYLHSYTLVDPKDGLSIMELLKIFIRDTTPLTIDQRKTIFDNYLKECEVIPKTGPKIPVVADKCRKIDLNVELYKQLNDMIKQNKENFKKDSLKWNMPDQHETYEQFLKRINELPLTEPKLRKLKELSQECKKLVIFSSSNLIHPECKI
jgi:hypothetical protein